LVWHNPNGERFLKKHKPRKMTGNARIAKKTDVGTREPTNILARANYLFSIASLVSKCWWLLQSLPWDKLHHLIS
jgi:hypothetical protein